MSSPELPLLILEAFVSAYRPYAETRLAERGWTVPDEVLTVGEVWLAENLAAQLELPLLEQRRGPLEVFQEAMQFPTEALAEQGIGPVARDAVTTEALPGDLYDLAPASSRDLGDDVWMAHIAWGSAKAQAFLDSQESGEGDR